jgi:CheY-like chemotaxis protein
MFLPHVADTPRVTPAHVVMPRSTGSETILLVEDQSNVRHLAVSVLRDCGYHLIEAETAEAALQQAESYPAVIHLLLTDVVLPGLTGRDLAERLLAVRPNLKVLYASGYAEDVVVHRGVVNPGIRYLQKPYAPHALAEKVRAVLDEQ